jgi:hypothetical protein
MESKGFLIIFSDLASGQEDMIRPAVSSLSQTLKTDSSSVSTVLGNLSNSLKYTLDRLLKGLTGSKLAKIGFSMGLTMIFREFQLKLEHISSYFQNLDHSGVSPFQVMTAEVLIYISLIRAEKRPPQTLSEKIVEIFKQKSSLKELVAVGIASDPERKRLPKLGGAEQDLNLLMINYSSMKPEGVLNLAGRHKQLIFKGSCKVMPRLHQIWKLLVSSSISTGKESQLWEVFVEKDVNIEDKKRDKRVHLSFLLFLEFHRQGADLSQVITPGFWNVWQDNLFVKKMREHEIASKAKTIFLDFIEKYKHKVNLITVLLQMVESLKVLDFFKSCFEKIIEKLDKSAKKRLIQEVFKFQTGKKANFAVNVIYLICKTPELQKLGIKKLLRFSLNQDSSSEAAKIKVLNLANDFSLADMILKFFRQDSEVAGSVLEKLKEAENFEILASQNHSGKRQAGDLAIVTSTQMENLVKVLKMLAIEGILYGNSADFNDFLRVLKKIVNGKAKNLDELMIFLLSSLAKPVGYMRFAVSKVFKDFVNEISEDFLSQLCKIMETGQFSIEIEEKPEENQEESQENNLLNEQNNSKLQEKLVRDSFLTRSSEFLEIVIKKSKNIDHKLKVYTSLLLALRSASKAKQNRNLVNRISAILQKIHKKELEVQISHKDQIKDLLLFCFKSATNDKNLSGILAKNMASLLKILQNLDQQEFEKILKDLVAKFFEKHSNSLKIEVLLEILTKNLENLEIFEKILEYVVSGRNPNTQIQASEVMKVLAKAWKGTSHGFLMKVLKCARKVEKSDVKLKVKNCIVKNLLCTLLALVKKNDKIDEIFWEKVEGLNKVLNGRHIFHGLFIQIKALKKSLE